MRIVSNGTANAGAALESEGSKTLYRRDSFRRETPAEARTYRIQVRDLDIAWSIGVFDHEHEAVQPIRINLELDASELENWQADDYANVPCYAKIAEDIRAMAAEGHVRLVETLAHRIALLCLADPRIQRARVRVEKPEALKNAESVGVEVERTRADLP